MNLEKENEAIHLNWNKIERDQKKNGYREGISAGRESNFQNSFDTGYQQGLGTGFAIGKSLAALQFSKIKDAQKNEVLLENPTRGWCQLCSGKEATPLGLPDIVRMQREATNNNLEKLYKRYENIVNVTLPEMLTNENRSNNDSESVNKS